MKKRIYLLGVGHNTAVFIDLAEDCGYEVAGLYHYNEERTGEIVNGFPIIGSFDSLFQQENLSGQSFLLTMGDNLIRHITADKIRKQRGATPALVHPSAVISRFAHVAEGVSICAFSYVQANSSIGKDTMVLSGVNISHNNNIGQACLLAGGVTIGAHTIVEDFVFVGQGALTISHKVKRIGTQSFIAAGALVTKPIFSYETVIGRPAVRKKSKSNNK